PAVRRCGPERRGGRCAPCASATRSPRATAGWARPGSPCGAASGSRKAGCPRAAASLRVGRWSRRARFPGPGSSADSASTAVARSRTSGTGLREPPVIVTVTLNAGLDRTLTVPNFQRGQRHRASQGLSLAGGKGINVARALKRLDIPVVATGLAGGRTGTRIVEELTAEAILN